MDSAFAWGLLLVFFGFCAYKFAKAILAEDERRRAENERGWLEYEAGLRGGL